MYSITGASPIGKPEADEVIIMHPFRTLPDTIDGVVCGRCGHPAWDHCVSDTCAECDNREADAACNVFSLAGFTAMTASTFEEYAIGH